MEMMKNMDPAMLKQMAGQTGMSEEALKQGMAKMGNLDPKTVERIAKVGKYLFKVYKTGKWLFTTRSGRITLAGAVAAFAYWWQFSADSSAAAAQPQSEEADMGGYST